MKQILLRGAPGTGKSTFARLFLDKVPGAARLSSGDVLRQTGGDSSSSMNRGELADSGLVMELMKQRYSEVKNMNHKILLLDGFPRKLSELDEWIRNTAPPIAVVSLVCDDDLIVSKLINRWICNSCGYVYNLFSNGTLKPIAPKKGGVCDCCSNGELVRRKDDSEPTIRRRLQVFRESELEVVNYIERQLPETVYISVNTDSGIDAISNSLMSIVKLRGITC